MQFFDYLQAMIPAPLRRTVAERLPHEKFQRLRKIVDTMHERSVHIYNEKRAAIERGDEGLKQQLGEGKDIMSILREYFIVHGRPCLCSLKVYLVRANMFADAEDRLSEGELIGQMS